MELWSITLIFFGSLVLFLATGLPIVFTLGGLAAVFCLWFWGLAGTFVFPMTAYAKWTDYILIAAPLFIYMGLILEHSGIADDLYETVYPWFGRLRGGLAIGTVAICAIFAAMCGTSSAATITMGTIALPSMLKRGYDKQLAVGCIMGGGALGILIPPSVLMILYASLTEVSVGKMFFGGLIPGIVLTLLFIIYIAIICRLRPQLGPSVPKEEAYSWKMKLQSLRAVILPALLIMLVLGTVFMGLATPTESAGIGALGALVCAAARKKLNRTILNQSLDRCFRITGFLLWIVVGAQCYSHVFIASGISGYILKFTTGLNWSPWALLILIQTIFMILGCFLDPLGVLLICIPVFMPIVVNVGFDPIWFGILYIINMEMAYLTPPFGFNLFYMRAVAPPGISMADIYRSIFPYVACQLICLILVIVFPQLALWLPNAMITR